MVTDHETRMEEDKKTIAWVMDHKYSINVDIVTYIWKRYISYLEQIENIYLFIIKSYTEYNTN